MSMHVAGSMSSFWLMYCVKRKKEIACPAPPPFPLVRVDAETQPLLWVWVINSAHTDEIEGRAPPSGIL